ncbi:Monoterpene epsilon-lactone hydrolase [Candidatus Entotheonellaceae bacterium PAL068K]
MANSPQLDHVIGLIKARLANPRQTIDDDRLSYETMLSSMQLEADIRTERVGAGGVPAAWICAPRVQDDQVVLYFHGGGYVIGSMRTHQVMLSHISRASGCKVLGLDYRLAPENPFPAPVEDALRAYRWLLANGHDPKKIALGGDSAGGGLVVAALVAMRYLGEPLPAAGVCLSPWVDMEATGASFRTHATADPSVSQDRILSIAKLYLGGKSPQAPLASPIHADLCGLPPLFVQVGAIETLLDDANALTERAKAAGVEVELEVWDDMPHVWQLFAPILPEGQQAIARIGDFLRKHVG